MTIEKVYEFRDDIFPRELPLPKIPSLYVPFHEISDQDPESLLATSIQENRMVVVHGESGCGKTSLVNYALSNLDDSYFPVCLSPLVEDIERVCTSPEEFTKFALSQVQGAVTSDVTHKCYYI